MSELKKTALVIEDDSDISFMISLLLRKEGFAVSVAEDGKAAMSLIDESGRPDIVLLDIMLPFHNGFELLEHLRAKPAWLEVPVLMMTAKTKDIDFIRALDAGATDYMMKPFQPIDLINRVKRLTSTH